MAPLARRFDPVPILLPVTAQNGRSRRVIFRLPAVRFALKAGFSALLVAWVVQRVDFQDIVDRLRQANGQWLWAALGCAIVSILLQAARWRLLTRSLLTYRQALTYTWIGIFYGAILPGGISGDIAKGTAVALKDASTRSPLLAVSIVADRVAGLYALSVLFLFSALAVFTGIVPGDAALIPAIRAGSALTVGFLAAATWLFSPTGQKACLRFASWAGTSIAGRIATHAAEAMGHYAQAPRLWLRVLPLSFLNHGANILTNCMLLLALGATLGWSQWVVFYSLISVLLMVPLSISGLGVRDWFTLLFFPAAGVVAEIGIAYSWLSLGLGLTTALAGGAIQLLEMFRPAAPDPKP